MPIVVSINNGAEYEPVSEGVHQAVIADIVDLGVVQTSFGPKDKVQFTWLSDEADENGRTKYLFKRYNKSLHEKSTLRKDVEKILGKPLGDAKDFDIERLIGITKGLVIQHNEGTDGKIYANITGMLKPNTKLTIPPDFQRKKDRPASNFGAQQQRPQVGGGRAAAAAVLAPAGFAAKSTITDDDIPF